MYHYTNYLMKELPFLRFFVILIVAVALYGCSEDDMYLTTKSKSLKVGSTFSIDVYPSEEGCTFESQNTLIARVSTEGIITGVRVGETNIVVKNEQSDFNATFKVTVTPLYSMYQEPSLEFGANKTKIEAFETQRLLERRETNLLVYQGENTNISDLYYYFNLTGYYSARCTGPIVSTSLLNNYLLDRYIYKSANGDTAYWVTLDSQTLIKSAHYTSVSWIVIYTKNPL